MDARPAATLEQIERFAEDVARSGGVPVHSPRSAQLAAFVRAEPLYTLDIARWEDARQPIADAMADSDRSMASLHHSLRSDE